MAEIIVVAGGIGSGKSTVTKQLAKYMPTINADEITNQIYQDESHPVSRKVISMFGRDIVDDGKINKLKLREKLTCQDDYIILGGCFDRTIREELQNFADMNASSRFVAWEVPLAIESGIHGDYLVAVVSPQSLRIDRVMARSKLSYEDVVLRIHCQATIETTIEEADYIIVNNGSMFDLELRTDVFYEGLRNV